MKALPDLDGKPKIVVDIAGVAIAIDPAEFGVRLDLELVEALKNELEELTCGALANVGEGRWTAGYDCDHVWRMVLLEEALTDPGWVARQIAKATWPAANGGPDPV